MSRLGGAFWFVLVIATGVANFVVKHTVQNLDDELATVRRKTIVEQKEIHELSADWTFLNQPELLADLNKRYVGLAPVSPKQVVAGIDSLPLRPAPPPPSAPADALPAMAATSPPAPPTAAMIPLEPAPALPAQLAAAPIAVAVPNMAGAPSGIPAAAPTTQIAAVISLEPAPAPPTQLAAAPVAVPNPIVKVAAAAPPSAAAPASLDALFAQVAGDR